MSGIIETSQRGCSHEECRNLAVAMRTIFMLWPDRLTLYMASTVGMEVNKHWRISTCSILKKWTLYFEVLYYINQLFKTNGDLNSCSLLKGKITRTIITNQIMVHHTQNCKTQTDNWKKLLKQRLFLNS